MCEEVRYYSASNFIAGGETQEFIFSTLVDLAYWDVSVVPEGTTTDIEITRKYTTNDASGQRQFHYVVQNNTSLDTHFNRSAIRVPC
jgi:hypothetical protein